MKSVLLIRHAKSSWDAPVAGDFDRPLNERGKTDAPMMARRLKKRHISIDQLISSPAKRAGKTAALFAEALSIPKKHIIFIDSLYDPAPGAFNEAIGSADPAAGTIAVFSHNPGITGFVNTLTGVKVDDMPTCGIYAVRSDARSWTAFEESEKEFWFFDYPRNEPG